MLEGKIVLLVDDDERNIFALSAVLKPQKPIIVEAIDGIDCLEKLKTLNKVDIVLLDMMMPNMDGYQTLKEIRKNKKTKHIPVISITAQAMRGDREKCLESGADDYCSKPIDIEILLKKIIRLLNL